MKMWQLTILAGVLLIGVGLYGYFGSDSKSPTAFIPAGFGAVLAICGFVASKENLRKHAMHAAAAVGLIGLIGALVRAIPGLLNKPADAPAGIPFAIQMQLYMAVICVIFVGLCVNSFIQARKARKAGGE